MIKEMAIYYKKMREKKNKIKYKNENEIILYMYVFFDLILSWS